MVALSGLLDALQRIEGCACCDEGIPVDAVVRTICILLVAAIPAVENQDLAFPVFFGIQQVIALGAEFELWPSGHADNSTSLADATLIVWPSVSQA